MAQPAIIIMGPTGVGKSDIALELAHITPSVICNSDAFQIYKPLTIGTAKPVLPHPSIPHYLFDMVHRVTQAETWSVAAYVSAFAATYNELSPSITPFVVGGSGFYAYSLLFPPRVPQTEKPVHESAAASGDIWQQLHAIDPHRAAQLHPHDHFRIQRALDIYHHTGKRPSELAPLFDPVIPIKAICFINRDRDDLSARIDRRARAMFDPWCAEVAALSVDWRLFSIRKGIIGYAEIDAHLRGACTKQEALDAIIILTKQYVKRQITFWRRLARHAQTQGILCKEVMLSPTDSLQQATHLCASQLDFTSV